MPTPLRRRRKAARVALRRSCWPRSPRDCGRTVLVGLMPWERPTLSTSLHSSSPRPTSWRPTSPSTKYNQRFHSQSTLCSNLSYPIHQRYTACLSCLENGIFTIMFQLHTAEIIFKNLSQNHGQDILKNNALLLTWTQCSILLQTLLEIGTKVTVDHQWDVITGSISGELHIEWILFPFASICLCAIWQAAFSIYVECNIPVGEYWTEQYEFSRHFDECHWNFIVLWWNVYF